jgi:membrane protein required for colicin V production
MNAVDYLLIAVILISGVIGVFRGLLREVVALVTWLAAIVLAWRYGDVLEPYLGGLLAGENVQPWAARGLIFVFVLLVGTAVGSVVNYFVRLSIFSGTDRFLGAVFGALRGVVAGGLLALLGQLVELDGERWWTESLLVPFAVSVGDTLSAVTGATIEQAKAEAEKI